MAPGSAGVSRGCQWGQDALKAGEIQATQLMRMRASLGSQPSYPHDTWTPLYGYPCSEPPPSASSLVWQQNKSIQKLSWASGPQVKATHQSCPLLWSANLGVAPISSVTVSQGRPTRRERGCSEDQVALSQLGLLKQATTDGWKREGRKGEGLLRWPREILIIPDYLLCLFSLVWRAVSVKEACLQYSPLPCSWVSLHV